MERMMPDYNQLDPKRNFYRTICDHIFHKSCLKASLNKSQLCPNCQTNLSVEDIFGQILTRQQTRLLDSNKAILANTPDLTPQSQSLSPELTQQISEMGLPLQLPLQAQQSKFLESLSLTVSEMVQKNIEEGLRKINLPSTSSMPNQTQSQFYFNLDFNRTESISQQPLNQLLDSQFRTDLGTLAIFETIGTSTNRSLDRLNRNADYLEK
uniref:RING-type domain-containing protein n=1 Tax=Glossina austeni TaxID=7395 RepID=A0A1A9V7D3_GLOAU